MATVTLRPNANALVGGSLYSLPSGDNALAHSYLSDNSDSSYIREFGNQSPPVEANSPYVYLECTTFSLPAGAVTKQMRGRARAASSDNGALGVIEVCNGGNSPYGGTYYKWTGITSIGDKTGNYVAVNLSQAEIDQLRLFVRVASFSYSLIYEAYIDIIYVTKPIVSSITIAARPLNRVVPVSWTTTGDGEGGGQTRYQMKVFTAAQYSIGGFNPESSPFVSSTGDVGSGAQSTSTPALVRNQTYRVYIKIAQTVNGASLWSDWAFNEFTMGGSQVSLAPGTKAPIIMASGTRAAITLADGKVV